MNLSQKILLSGLAVLMAAVVCTHDAEAGRRRRKNDEHKERQYVYDVTVALYSFRSHREFDRGGIAEKDEYRMQFDANVPVYGDLDHQINIDGKAFIDYPQTKTWKLRNLSAERVASIVLVCDGYEDGTSIFFPNRTDLARTVEVIGVNSHDPCNGKDLLEKFVNLSNENYILRTKVYIVRREAK